MSDQGPSAAPVAAPAAAEAPAAPVAEAEQPVSPLKKESFREAFERHQAKVEGTAPEKAAEPAAPKSNGKKVVKSAEPEFEALNALAKKLGMKVEDGRILPSDRAKFREWERKRSEQLATTEKERLSAVEKREKEVEAQIKSAQSILKAKADGDYQGLAKELGFENWDKLQEDVIARISDPNYKRLRELEQWKEEEASRAEKSKAEQEQQQAQQRAMQQRQAVYKKFAEEMPQSKDPLVAAMGDHPLFTNTVLRIQEQMWKEHGALSYEFLANQKAEGAPRTLREECKELYDRLHKVYGGQQQAAPAKVRPMPGKSAPVAPSRGTEASSAKVMTREERNAYERRRLAEAIERDRKAAEG
jgi:hypothetical protein